MITSHNMKSRKLKKIVFISVIFLWIGAASCTDPLHDEPRYISLNKTSYSIQTSVANNSELFIGALTNLNEVILKDGGGQLDLDSIVFIRGTEIRATGEPDRTHELIGVLDSITYINPRHLTDQAYELVKGRSFFNIENWISEGKDFVYSVYDSDFE